MKLIEPNVELWSEENVTPEQHVARCAAVCYNSHPKDPQRLYESLWKSGHRSMYRHATHYYATMGNDKNAIAPPYTNYAFIDEKSNKPLVVSVNGQANKEYGNKYYFGDEVPLENLLEAAKDNPRIFSIIRLTFCLTTQISTSRELNRTSPNNIAERSTRYCSSKDGLEICKPWWWNDEHYHEGEIVVQFAPYEHPEKAAVFAWEQAELGYNDMLRQGMKPEDARGLLPLDTATKVVYTYSVREWEHLLALRYYEKTGKAHPNAKLIMGMVRDKINQFAKEHNIDYEV